MRILIPLLSFGKWGGIKVLTNLANYWTDAGHDVTFVVASKENLPYYPLKCHVLFIAKDGIGLNPEINAEPITIMEKLKSLYLFIKYNYSQFDSIIANYNLTAYPIFLASKSNNFYYIQAYEPEFTNEIKNVFKKNIFKFLAWFSYFLPLKKIVNSKMYLNYKNIKASDIIFPGLNLNIYSPKILKYKAPNEKFTIGCIGREEEWKGSQDVAEAIKILHKQGYENIEFIVAFNPVSYENHTLVYPDGDEKLADFYRSLDILVTPGHIQLDAIHYPVIESMAVKTPLITTGYYPANKTNSYIVPIKSPNSIVDAVVYIMNNYHEAIEKSNNAFETIEQFKWENLSDKFISIMENK